MSRIFHLKLLSNLIYCDISGRKLFFDSIEIGGIRVAEASGASRRGGFMVDTCPTNLIFRTSGNRGSDQKG
jgi:hypothetical protein